MRPAWGGNSFLIHQQRHQPGASGKKGRFGMQMARFLHGYDTIGRHEGCGNDLNCFRETAGQEDLIGHAMDAADLTQVAGDFFP